MCFSAHASFIAGGLLIATGVVAGRRASRLNLDRRTRALSLFPIVFGVQQSLEGVVWLGIEGLAPPNLALFAAYGFLFFALSFWPIAGPVTAFVAENCSARRCLFALSILAGIVVSLYLAFIVLANPLRPVAVPKFGGHIAYLHGVEMIEGIEYIYCVTACAALVLSSSRNARLFGCALAFSFGVTMLVFPLDVVPSVWCFFAALCSAPLVAPVMRRSSTRSAV